MGDPKYSFTQEWFFTCDLHCALARGLLDTNTCRKILEIGCLEGSASTFFSDHIMEHPDSRLVCVDPFDAENPTTIQEKGGQYTKNLFLENIKKSKNYDKIKLEEYYSVDFYKKNEEQFDFIYIDGSHLVEDVALDFVECEKILKPGGIMWMDDYLWGDGGIKKRVDELAEEYSDRLEIIFKRYQIGFRKK